MRSVWLSPGFPAAPAALLDALGAQYTLAPQSSTPPAGAIAVVTGFERDLLASLATRPTGTSLLVITPPDATAPISDLPGLAPDAVCAAASIAEVADALKRLPSAAPLAAGFQDLPWWVRPTQDDAAPDVAAPAAEAPHDTAVLATTPLPVFGEPVDPPGAAPTETLGLGAEPSSHRRFALTGRRARTASIAAVVIAVAATALVVRLDSHSSASNTAATSGLGSNGTPFGNSNGSGGSNGVNPFSGQGGGSGNSNGSGQGNGTTPQFGAPGAPFGDHDGSGNRQQEFQQFLTCLKQHGVSTNTNSRPFVDPTDPHLRTALRSCASVLPFGRFHGRDDDSAGGAEGNGSHRT